jgi:hypothetical protein
VHLAPPARRNHIAHYIRLDKAELKFGGDVLQIDNACADAISGVPLLRQWRRHSGAFVRCSKCTVFGKRRIDQLNVKFDLKRTSTRATLHQSTGFGHRRFEASVGGSRQ